MPATVLAAPLSLQVDAAASDVSLTVMFLDSMFGGSGTGSASVSGNLNLDVDWTTDPLLGSVPSSLEVVAGDVELGGMAFEAWVGFFGFVDITADLLESSLVSPRATGIAPATGMNVFDLSGTTLSIDAGLLSFDAFGPITGFGDLSVDFAQQPAEFVALPGSTVKLVEEPLSPQQSQVTLVLPLNLASTLRSSPVDVTATITGQLIATGIRLVPEPSGLLLLAVGIVSFYAVRRRWST